MNITINGSLGIGWRYMNAISTGSSTGFRVEKTQIHAKRSNIRTGTGFVRNSPRLPTSSLSRHPCLDIREVHDAVIVRALDDSLAVQGTFEQGNVEKPGPSQMSVE